MLQLFRRRGVQVFNEVRIARNHNAAVKRFDKGHNAAQEDQSFKLPDGRTMGFAEYGDLKGIPTFCLHGSPGSRYDGMGFEDPAKKRNMRIICPDCPGFSLSSDNPSRKLSEYARDISALAKRLRIPKYHVFGGSGGGPYTVACAHSSPKNELLNVAVVAGMGPPELITVKDAGWYTVTALGLIKWFPGLMRSLSSWGTASEEKLEKQLKSAFKWLLTKEDMEYLSDPKEKALLMKSYEEAYKQGALGAIRDCQIYGIPWDFKLGDIQRKIKLFYGGKDTRTPLAFGWYLKHHMPNAELYEYGDASHVTICKYNDEILGNLIGACRPVNADRC